MQNSEEKIYSVTAITRLIKYTLEESWRSIWVEGEISNYLLHRSGHRYLSLKDENAVLNDDFTNAAAKLTLVKKDLETLSQLICSDRFHDMIGVTVYRAIEESYRALLLFKGQTVDETYDLNQLQKACAPYCNFGLYTQGDLLNKVTEFSQNPSCGLMNYEKEIFAEAAFFAQLLFESVSQLVQIDS